MLEALADERDTLFALVDPTRSPRVLQLLRESVEYSRSLYEGSAGDTLADVAPYLVELPDKRSRLVTALVTEGLMRRWGVFLTSTRPFKDVRRHFRRFLVVREEDTGSGSISASTTPSCCAPFCRRAPCSSSESSSTRSASSSPKAIAASSFASPWAPKSPRWWGSAMMTIQKRQIEAIGERLARRWEDTMVVHIETFFPESAQELGAEGVRHAIDLGLKKAARYGITSERDVCKFLNFMFAYGFDFDRDPELPGRARSS